MSKETGAHEMNDTTETGLVEQIQLLVSAGSIWYSPEDYIPMSGVEQLNIGLPATTAERIIALCRRAAWREFEAAIRGQSTTEAAGLHLSKFALLPYHYRTDPEYKQQTDDVAAGVVQAALQAIAPEGESDAN